MVAGRQTHRVSWCIRGRTDQYLHNDRGRRASERFAGSRGAGSLSWSSRNAIAYATVQGIFRVDSRGHHTKTLVSSGAVGGPEWTPSGDRLLFGQLSGRRGTWSIDSNGKGRRFENREFGLLSPSGKRLLSAGDDGEFVISSLDGGSAKTVDPDIPSAWGPGRPEAWQAITR